MVDDFDYLVKSFIEVSRERVKDELNGNTVMEGESVGCYNSSATLL